MYLIKKKHTIITISAFLSVKLGLEFSVSSPYPARNSIATARLRMGSARM